MTSTSLDLSSRPDLVPVAELAGEVTSVATALDIPVFMVGAMARDLILAYGYGIDTSRRTEDMDWAMAVESWEQFEALKDRLLASGRFAARKEAHRLKYREIMIVDLVPFGVIEDRNGVISWPPEHEINMSVLGFREAYHRSVVVQLPGGVSVRLACLPALAMLKLLAWDDRKREFPKKDVQDFTLIVRHYVDAGNQDRLYGQFVALLEEEGFDYELVGAWMLGRDMAEIFGEAARKSAFKILEREANVRGALAFVSAMPMDAEKGLALLEKVLKGLKEGADPESAVMEAAARTSNRELSLKP